MKHLLTTLIFTAFVTLTVVAQNTEVRQLDDFKTVSVGEAIKLVLVPGNRNQAEIRSENVDLEEIETKVSGERLKIELSGNRYRNIEVEITLTYRQLNGLMVSSAASVMTKGAIKAENLEISVSSAGEAKIEVNTGKLAIDVSSSGELTTTGKTASQRVSVSSAGEYKGYELDCQDTYVRASSAGSARVSASQEIDARASSAGSVKYKGNPDKVYVSSSSGGSASKVN